MFFNCNNGYANAPQCYIIRTLPVLLFSVRAELRKPPNCRNDTLRVIQPQSIRLPQIAVRGNENAWSLFDNVWHALCLGLRRSLVQTTSTQFITSVSHRLSRNNHALAGYTIRRILYNANRFAIVRGPSASNTALGRGIKAHCASFAVYKSARSSQDINSAKYRASLRNYFLI
jgi:hypothetical protein